MKVEVLSTRQVAQLLGVGEATVKRWADAEEIGCFRTPGGHRKFRLSDVAAFVRSRQFGPTARLPGLNAEVPVGPAAAAAFEKAALAGNPDALIAQLATHHLRGMTLAQIFDDVVGLALRRIGGRWEACELSVADEHVASSAVIEAIARAQPLAEPPGEANRAQRGTAVVSAVAGEQHDLPARMAACLLRASGFQVLAPLAQTPSRDLAELVVRTRARLVVLSASVTADPAIVAEQVAASAAAVRQVGGRLLVGGGGMDRLSPLPPDVTRASSLVALMSEVEHPPERTRAGRQQARGG